MSLILMMIQPINITTLIDSSLSLMRWTKKERKSKILRDIVHSPFVYGSWHMEMRFPLQTKSINSQLKFREDGSLNTIEYSRKRTDPVLQRLPINMQNNFINYSSNKVKYSVIYGNR